MVAVDTNVLVRAFVDLESAERSRAEKRVAECAWVSLLVLQEFAWVAGSIYRLDAVRLGEIVDRLLVHETVVFEQPLVVRAALERLRDAPKLGLSDCLVLEMARAAGKLPLVTFDRELGKQEGAQKA